MDELKQHFKNLEENEILKRIDDAYNRGWNDAMNNPEVKKALERMKPKKPDNSGKYKRTCFCGKTVYIGVNKFCSDCGQALDWEV